MALSCATQGPSTPKHKQLVYFMTNRVYDTQFAVHRNPEKAYKSQQRVVVDYVDTAFDCGFVEVKVPVSHTPGGNAKHFTMSVLEKRAVEDSHPGVGDKIVSVVTCRPSFIDSILCSLGESSGELVLFIHGFNVSWPSAIKKAAQLTWDTSHTSNRRVALAFDWASIGSPFNYAFTPYDNDRGRIDDAQDHLPCLLQMLEKLMVQDKGRRFKALHIVAHSMGNLVLQRGLSNALLLDTANAMKEGIRCKPPSGSDILRKLVKGGIRMTITFAAPDVDHASMHSMLNNLSFLCPASCTLYCSRNDKPLQLSTAFARMCGNDLKGRAGFYSWGLGGRAGRSNHTWHVYMHAVVKTIKLNRTQGHGYFANDKEILQDISSFMAGSPEERKITPVSDEDTKCLMCRCRIRTLRKAVNEWPMFKLAPPAAADAKVVREAEPAA